MVLNGVMKTDSISALKRILLLILVVSISAVGGLGCNTANGFGKDMERTGEKIQDGTR